jgi:hypothetical protein
MSSPDDHTRQLLAPRRRAGHAEADLPSRGAPRRARWRLVRGAVLAAGVITAVLIGQWLRQSMRSPAGLSATPEQQQAVSNSIVPASPSPPRPIEPAVKLAVPAIIAVPPESAITATQAPVPTGRLADLTELLKAPPSAQLRWARFKANPAVLVIEYPNLYEQGLAMNRLAAMFEKRTARRDRVPTDTELAAIMRRSGDSVASFYQGHDYPAAKVALFFGLAETQRIPLNKREQQLRSLTLEARLITRSPSGTFEASESQAVISFTGVQPDDPTTGADEHVDAVRREAVLRHELSHGEFFTDPAYRAHCLRFWRQELREAERRVFTAYLKGLDYNPADDELMANETQALLMHTPDGRAFNASSLGMGEAALAQLRTRFRSGEPTHGLNR